MLFKCTQDICSSFNIAFACGAQPVPAGCAEGGGGGRRTIAGGGGGCWRGADLRAKERSSWLNSRISLTSGLKCSFFQEALRGLSSTPGTEPREPSGNLTFHGCLPAKKSGLEKWFLNLAA